MATAQAKSSNSSANSPVTDRATEAAHHAVDSMSDKAAHAEDSIRRTAASSKAAIDQKQEEMRLQMMSSYERTKKFAQDNPLAAAGIAFATGMVVSALLRRGR